MSLSSLPPVAGVRERGEPAAGHDQLRGAAERGEHPPGPPHQGRPLRLETELSPVPPDVRGVQEKR